MFGGSSNLSWVTKSQVRIRTFFRLIFMDSLGHLLPKAVVNCDSWWFSSWLLWMMVLLGCVIASRVRISARTPVKKAIRVVWLKEKRNNESIMCTRFSGLGLKFTMAC